MDEILFISYYFPPVGGAGVQRSLKFCRYLPDEGILPIVLAGPAEPSGHWEPTDPQMMSELRGDLPVYRPPSGPPNITTSGWSRMLGRSAPRYRWWGKAIHRTGMEVMNAHRPRAVYVSLSPYESLKPALELAKIARIPLLADLRDPWALDEVKVYPSRIHRRLARAYMEHLLAQCDRVLWNTPEALHSARTALPSIASKFHCLPNGFDSADFEGVEPRRPDGRFRIVHAGYLHSQVARSSISRTLGGELWPIDFLGRSHRYLLEALEQLLDQGPSEAERIEVLFVGQLSEADLQLIRRSPASRLCRVAGYLDHLASVRELVRADLLFLPLHGLPAGRRARIVPAKAYEYLASGRPILAAVPAGDVRDLVQTLGAGLVVDPLDVQGIKAAIMHFQATTPGPSRLVGRSMARFERQSLTRELSEHLRSLF